MTPAATVPLNATVPLPVFEIRRLRRAIEIGCAPEEHGVAQAVELSLRLALAPEALFAGDTRTPPYDYCRAIDAVDAAIAARPHTILQETLVLAIAARVLADADVQSVEIHLEKTERYAGCDAIGVHAVFTRATVAALAARYPEDEAVQHCAAGHRAAGAAHA